MNTLRNVLTQSEKDGVAVGHFNVATFGMLKAVLSAATELRVPVLVGASEGIWFPCLLCDAFHLRPNQLTQCGWVGYFMHGAHRLAGQRQEKKP